MAYKDMTFCASDCTNTKCFRFFSEETKQAARKWWGGEGALIAFSDFSKDCEEYRK